MGVTLVDARTVLQEFLLGTDNAAGVALNAAIGNRAWPDEPFSSFKNTQKAVVFSVRVDLDLRRTSQVCEVVVKSFGGSNKRSDARATARLVFSRLDGGSGSTASGGITLARCLKFDMGLFGDPDTGWPIHLSRYEARIY